MTPTTPNESGEAEQTGTPDTQAAEAQVRREPFADIPPMVSRKCLMAADDGSVRISWEDIRGIDSYIAHQHEQSRVLRQQLEAAQARVRDEWRSIETAPKDGTVFLAYRYRLGSFSWMIVYFGSGEFRLYHTGALLLGLTHWMPLPDAPDAALAVCKTP